MAGGINVMDGEIINTLNPIRISLYQNNNSIGIGLSIYRQNITRVTLKNDDACNSI